MWKPDEVIPENRRRAVIVWVFTLMSIVAYTGWLLHKIREKMKSPDTSFVLTNVVYKYPDLWVCPYQQYGCDTLELETECANSARMTEAGPPDAVFYPRERLGQDGQTATEELEITARIENTNPDDDDTDIIGRGNCVVFETSAATAFVGQERDPHEYLDYILLDMYWYPGGESGNSTTCVPDGQAWEPHREWIYAFLSDPEDRTMVSTGIQLSYSCITDTSTSHIFNQIVIGLTDQHKYRGDDSSSYKAITTNFGFQKDTVNSSIVQPYARLSLEMKQQFDSWEIITESDPLAFAEMFGNIGGFWDLLLILWPIFFVAVSPEEPHLKPRTFKKSIVRGAERAAGITKVIAVRGPIRRSGTIGDATNAESLEDGFEPERPSWETPGLQRQGSVLRRTGTSSRVLQR